MEIKNFMIDIIATVVMTIGPFAGIYMYIKNSNKLMSMAMGAVSKLGSGLVNASNKWASQKQKNSRFAQAWAGRESAINEAAQRRAYSKFKNNPRYMSLMGRDAKQIMSARINKANEAIESDAVAQAMKTLPYYNPTAFGSDIDKITKMPARNDRRRMADHAFEAMKKGDMVTAHALAASAAMAGADEFKGFHTILQENIDNDTDPGGKWNRQRVEQMKALNGRVLTNYASDLRPKSMGVVSALERSFTKDDKGNTIGPVDIGTEMVSPGMQKFYEAMGAEQIAVFSTEAAEAAAQYVTPEALRDVIENQNIRGRMKKGTRKAYEAEYIKKYGKLPYKLKTATTTPPPTGTPPASGTPPATTP